MVTQATASHLEAANTPSYAQPAFGRRLYAWAIIEAFKNLGPKRQARNPAMLMLAVAGSLTLALSVWAWWQGSNQGLVAGGSMAACLWLNAFLFSLADALIRGHGRGWTEAVRRKHTGLMAKKLSKSQRKGEYDVIPAIDLRPGDVVLVTAGETMPADGQVLEGSAMVDESALLCAGEPVVRQVDGDHNAVAGGTHLLSGWLLVRVSTSLERGLLNRAAAVVAGAGHPALPSKVLVGSLLAAAAMALSLLLVRQLTGPDPARTTSQHMPLLLISLVSLLAALAPTTTAGLMHVVQIGGIDRLIQRGIVPLSEHMVAMASAVDTLLLDRAAVTESASWQALAFGGLEGEEAPQPAWLITETSLSQGLAGAAARDMNQAGRGPETSPAVVGVVHLKGALRQGLKGRLARLRRLGIHSILTTSDPPLVAAAMAAEAGMDDFVPRSNPEAKLALIHRQRARGQRLAVAASSVDHVSVLAGVDLALAGHTIAHLVPQAAAVVDLYRHPDGLIEVVEIARQRILTRRVLTVLSAATDVTRCLVLILATLASIHLVPAGLNLLRLSSPTSAVLSTLIFNVFALVALVPLAWSGVPFRLMDTPRLLGPTLFLCGLAGVIATLLGIKLVDLALMGLGIG